LKLLFGTTNKFGRDLKTPTKTTAHQSFLEFRIIPTEKLNFFTNNSHLSHTSNEVSISIPTFHNRQLDMGVSTRSNFHPISFVLHVPHTPPCLSAVIFLLPNLQILHIN
jgi:hypothetical protein